MQYMMIVRSGRECEAGKPSDEMMAAVGSYTQELRKAGALVELSRLHPSSKAARVRLQGNDRVVTDGPFAETKELVGGYWIIQAGSLDEAIEWAKRAPAPADQAAEIEIRQFLEMENFYPEGAADRAPSSAHGIAKTKVQSQ